jgi:hypothetical protein
MDGLDAEEPNVEILGHSSVQDDLFPEPLRPGFALDHSFDAGPDPGTPTPAHNRPQRPRIETRRLEALRAPPPPPPPHSAKRRDMDRVRSQSPLDDELSNRSAELNSSLDSILLAQPSTTTSPTKKTGQPIGRKRTQQENPVTSRPTRVQPQPQPRKKARVTSDDQKSSSGTSSRPGASASRTTSLSSARTNSGTGQTTAASSVSSVPSLGPSSRPENPAKAKIEIMPPPPIPAPTANLSPRKGNSRLPVPTAPQQSPLLTMANITAKLAASQRGADVARGADAARVRAKLNLARNKPPGRTHLQTPRLPSDDATRPRRPAVKAEDTREETASPTRRVKGDRPKDSPRKRERRTSKVADRRRSTLTHLEMDQLLCGDSSPAKALD